MASNGVAPSGAVVIDMGDNAGAAANGGSNTNGSNKDKEKKDSLFGPNIGVISAGPSWTALNEKKILSDELTKDVVKGWVKKSKMPSQPTTTLQALVNLKRPTLKLTPLSSDSPTPSQNHSLHGVEFEFDCDAPKCGIYVSVLVPTAHPDAPKPPVNVPGMPNAKVLVFESVVAGGFGRHLDLNQGAALDLARFDSARSGSEGGVNGEDEDDSALVISPTTVNGSTTTANTTTATPATATTNTNTNASNTGSASRTSRRRFTSAFHFLKRPHQNRTAAGPALAVVDASADPNNPAAAAANTTTPATAQKKSPNGGTDSDEDDEGVRVMIRLAALAEDETELDSINEQVTYLHVVRFGAKPVANAAAEPTPAPTDTPAAEEANGTPKEGEATADGDATKSGDAEKDASKEAGSSTVTEGVIDNRPWVVKVVKREATIGPHTFHLHEIYGLSSSSTVSANTNTTPLPTSHTYPPSSGPAPLSTAGEVSGATENNEDPTSECLLCLSSPREVVLLPCRHLVACKECAINMVEFGAGGTVQPSTAAEPSTSGANAEGGAATGEGGEGSGAATAPAPVTPTPAATVTTRRKRKAKGWFCPVCRQPYTSLLRITTTPPPAVEESPGADAPADKEEVTTPVANAASGTATSGNNATANGTGAGERPASSSGGVARLLSLRRPGFLRSLSGRSNGDIEAQA